MASNDYDFNAILAPGSVLPFDVADCVLLAAVGRIRTNLHYHLQELQPGVCGNVLGYAVVSELIQAVADRIPDEELRDQVVEHIKQGALEGASVTIDEHGLVS